MIISFLAADRYTLKIKLQHEGGTGAPNDDAVIQGSTLIAQMVEGPLRDMFNVTGLTLAEARTAITENEHFELIAYSTSAAAGPAWAFDLNVVSGGPGLTVHGDADSPDYLVELNYRHSTGR